MPGGAAALSTTAYMAPEQWNCAQVTSASDWYAVGVLLFESLTGGLPFTGSAQQVLVRKRTISAPAPGMLVSGVPQPLDSLCQQLLRASPGARGGAQAVLAATAALSD